MPIATSAAAAALARLPRRYRPKACARCGATFQTKGRGRYCSRRCQNQADYQRHADLRRASKRRDREAAAS